MLDGAARQAGKPLYDFLGLGFRENQHVTSFTIGIDTPEMMHQKTLAAAQYPVLKLKVGAPNDKENMRALREAAPKKWVRVDANEGWTTKEYALEMIEWLAKDGFIQYIEQPMPAVTPIADMAWLKARSPLPLFADESYHTAADAAQCAEGFLRREREAVQDRRREPGATMRCKPRAKPWLKTMLGCMIETGSILISPAKARTSRNWRITSTSMAAHPDHERDPYHGVTAEKRNDVLSRARPKKIEPAREQ